MNLIRRTSVVAVFAIGILTASVRAQTCYHFGSHFVAATIEASPTTLACAAAPGWPAWHLFTPPHREPGPHTGFNPGHAHELPRVLVAYRCTGWLLVPVVPWRFRTMGYVIDQPEHVCSGST